MTPTIPEGYGLDTPLRRAHFMAQLHHESGGFRYLREIWGPTVAQKRYEPPSDLAKKLGNTEPGDGRRYAGRGWIQLTGRANYRHYGALLGLDLERDPELAAKPAIAMRIAGEYWKAKHLNVLADKDCLECITKKINGGLNGLDDRRKWLDHYKRNPP